MKAAWPKSMCKELGRLAQGYGNKEGTNTVFFMSIDEIKQIPKDRTVTYAKIVVDYRPEKDDTNSVRITAGSNLIDYLGETDNKNSRSHHSKNIVEQRPKHMLFHQQAPAAVVSGTCS
jgi:hypothetical protein